MGDPLGSLCSGHLEIHRKHKSSSSSKSEAAVRRLWGCGCYTQTFKKTPNIWHMPSCGEARVSLLSAEPHLFTDMAFLRQPVMPIGERRRGVLRRDPTVCGHGVWRHRLCQQANLPQQSLALVHGYVRRLASLRLHIARGVCFVTSQYDCIIHFSCIFLGSQDGI